MEVGQKEIDLNNTCVLCGSSKWTFGKVGHLNTSGIVVVAKLPTSNKWKCISGD